MALTAAQLKILSELADRWLVADSTAKVALLQDARDQGEAVDRAFAAMIAQLATTSSATLLPPISEALRDAALAASMSVASTTPSLTDAMPTREPGQHIGPYRLIKELGRGGMGVVWLAERADGQHSRQVALKMPLVENLNWLLAARFARERNILASLEHPSIARLYDAGVDQADRNAQPYIAIEYVQGQPITDYVQEKRLKPEATAQLFIRVIEAVAHAHTQLVIHRDIKPSNILVDAKGEPHLLDFGIAKLLDDEDGQGADATQLTRLSGRALTLDYASPEQVNNASLGTASDVYSLGVVLYELLTGSRPYRPKGSTRRDLEQAILDQDPSKPSDQLLTANTGDSESGKSARRMRGDLDTVVLKALRKDPKQRYATAQAFADDLKRYLAYEPIAAKPDAGWYRAGRFVRRNRWALAASGVIAATVAVGVVSTLWQAQRAETEAARANSEAAQKTLEAARASSEAANARHQTQLARAATEHAESMLAVVEQEKSRAITASREAHSARAFAQTAAVATAQQRDEAMLQSRIARSEANRADATNDFLVSAFAAAKPGNAEAAPTTVIQVTEEAVKNALADVNMVSTVRVPLLTQLGTVLAAQGRIKEAQALHANNFSDARQRLGGADWATANAGIALATVQMTAGDFSSSRTLLDELLLPSLPLPAAQRSALLGVSGVLASRMRERGRAIDESSRAYEICRTQCRVEDAIERGSEYGNVLTTFGHHSQAMAVYREVDVLISSRYGERHLRRATVLAAMSRASRLLHDAKAAVSLAEQALAIDDAVLAKSDHRRGLHLYFLGLAQLEFGAHEAARRTLDESVSISRSALGARHPDLAHQLNMLGLLLLQMREFEAAVDHLAEAVDIADAALGANHRLTLLNTANYGFALAAAGKKEQGVALLDGVLLRMNQVESGLIEEALPALEKRAQLAIESNSPEVALRCYERIKVLLERLGGKRLYWRARLPLGLGWANLMLEKMDDANRYLAVVGTELPSVRPRQAEVAVQYNMLMALLRAKQGDSLSFERFAKIAREEHGELRWASQLTELWMRRLAKSK